MNERTDINRDKYDLSAAHTDPTDFFGDRVFNDCVMRTRLSDATYHSLKETIDAGEPLDSSIAGEVAAAMKQWAVEKGATHYTHWFMPMTGTTGEKHDSFIEPTGDGKVILEFSGNALIKGEPDASSFPSGGLRETAAARGYTAWDCTSPAFVKEGTLFIPTAFFSYTGEVLDKKAPLLRSVEALNRQGMRILRILGNKTARKIVPTIGPEQEYFLIDKEHYKARPDLRYTGRTLFGARPPKGQELSDHYYGALSDRISAYMRDLDRELWLLGISAKTKHNEVAPGQHELAVVFDPSAVASDRNLLTMEMMKKIALRHGLVCLLHEKPFAGLSGSGKHVNWSLATDDGVNLLDPGPSPSENHVFLLFFGAVIAALDTYSDLMLVSVSTAANEHRLGSHEAPPAILSISIGEELEELIEAIEKDKPLRSRDTASTNLGVASMSLCTVDTTDRNRTSPFAFTGNRFEFRMPGSSLNISGPCFILNAVVAQALGEIADELADSEDVPAHALSIFKSIMMRHKRIIYNGDNYAVSWSEEASRRGLKRLDNAVEAIHNFIDELNINVLAAQNVLTPAETISRHDMLLDNYSQVIAIEARTSVSMVRRDILPACLAALSELSRTYLSLERAGLEPDYLSNMIGELNELTADMKRQLEALEATLLEAEAKPCGLTQAVAFSTDVRDERAKLRMIVDAAEQIVARDLWPYPSYGDMLYTV